jgi:hypothetical protein
MKPAISIITGEKARSSEHWQITEPKIETSDGRKWREFGGINESRFV